MEITSITQFGKFGLLGMAFFIIYVLVKDVIVPLVRKKNGRGTDKHIETLAQNMAQLSITMNSLYKDNSLEHKDMQNGIDNANNGLERIESRIK